jgi:hypothetical protein
MLFYLIWLLGGQKNIGTRDGYDSVSREQDGLDADKDSEYYDLNSSTFIILISV